MIVNQEQIKMLGSNTLFRGVSKDFLKPVIKAKNYFGVKEGTLIYSNGDESSELFLIVEGEVKLKFSSKNKVEHRFITDFFGEEEILCGEKRFSHAIANNDCILYKINAEDLKGLISQNKKIAENLNHKNGRELNGNQESIVSEEQFEKANITQLSLTDLSEVNLSDGPGEFDNFTEDELNQAIDEK